MNRKCPSRNTILQTADIDPIPSYSPTSWIIVLVNKLEPYCKQANCQNFHIWNSHHQRAAWLFQTTPYDRRLLCNGLASCLSSYISLKKGKMAPERVLLPCAGTNYSGHLPTLVKKASLGMCPIVTHVSAGAATCPFCSNYFCFTCKLFSITAVSGSLWQRGNSSNCPNNNTNNNNNNDIYSAVIVAAQPLREFTRFTWWIQPNVFNVRLLAQCIVIPENWAN